MTKLQKFLTSTAKQAKMAKALNEFASLCAAQAIVSGFTEDQQALQELIKEHGTEEQVDWFNDCVLQAELARISSEVGEAVEGVRNYHMDAHIPEMENFIIELADVIIRCGDTAHRNYYELGTAIVSKMLYNAMRPHKHGKRS
jgi:NTP pyrophosphatase (non-canonical NTP hydrolase)